MMNNGKITNHAANKSEWNKTSFQYRDSSKPQLRQEAAAGDRKCVIVAEAELWMNLTISAVFCYSLWSVKRVEERKYGICFHVL